MAQAHRAARTTGSRLVTPDAEHGMALIARKVFGPVIGIQRLGGDEEAVRLMKRHRVRPYRGRLHPDEARARRILAQVRSGSVY